MITQRMQDKSRQDWRRQAPGTRAVVASSGISVHLWRLYAQAWWVCLLFPIAFLVQAPLAPGHLVTAVGGLVIFVIIYTWYMWPHPLSAGARSRLGFRASLLLLAGFTVLALSLSLVYGAAFLWLFVGISAVVGVVLPARGAFIAVMALTLLTLGLGVALSGGVWITDWLHIIPLVLLVRGLGLDMAGVARLSLALRELHAARSELARQAVIEERLRLARDLHDLLGHSLSLITLKSELAGRLIEKEPVRAAQEIREVESAARQALREVREAVAGYRQPTLLGEIEGAREILAAAGIACTVEHSTGALPPAIDTVIAWTVREGVTNVIRHSRARQCLIRVSGDDGKIRAEILNDGCKEPDRDLARSRSGSGLAGLTERVNTEGGQLEAGLLLSEDTRRFRLWVEIPLRKSERKSQP